MFCPQLRSSIKLARLRFFAFPLADTNGKRPATDPFSSEGPIVIQRNSLPSAFLIATLAASGPSRAADITVSHADSFDIVHIDGQITQEDPDEFDRVTQGLGEMFNRPVIVILNSPGGNILVSLAIGETVRSHSFVTGVVNNALCASGCAMIWVAGMPRFLGNRQARLSRRLHHQQ
jgi:hypothetical protein